MVCGYVELIVCSGLFPLEDCRDKVLSTSVIRQISDGLRNNDPNRRLAFTDAIRKLVVHGVFLIPPFFYHYTLSRSIAHLRDALVEADVVYRLVENLLPGQGILPELRLSSMNVVSKFARLGKYSCRIKSTKTHHLLDALDVNIQHDIFSGLLRCFRRDHLDMRWACLLCFKECFKNGSSSFLYHYDFFLTVSQIVTGLGFWKQV